MSKAEADAAEKEAKAVKSRMAELKRKQQAGELTDEEKAELRCECSSRTALMSLMVIDDTLMTMDAVDSDGERLSAPDWHRLRLSAPDWHQLRLSGSDWHRLRLSGPDWHRLRLMAPPYPL